MTSKWIIFCFCDDLLRRYRPEHEECHSVKQSNCSGIFRSCTQNFKVAAINVVVSLFLLKT